MTECCIDSDTDLRDSEALDADLNFDQTGQSSGAAVTVAFLAAMRFEVPPRESSLLTTYWSETTLSS